MSNTPQNEYFGDGDNWPSEEADNGILYLLRIALFTTVELAFDDPGLKTDLANIVERTKPSWGDPTNRQLLIFDAYRNLARAVVSWDASNQEEKTISFSTAAIAAAIAACEEDNDVDYNLIDDGSGSAMSGRRGLDVPLYLLSQDEEGGETDREKNISAPPFVAHEALNGLHRRGPDWMFWTQWFEGVIVGNPINWEIQFKVATEITDDEWEAGPTTVARRIAEIRAKFDVHTLATELAEIAYQAEPGTRGIGDNNPPSLIDDSLPTQPVETIIWVAASELREQAGLENPDTSAVQRAVEVLVGVVKATGLWAAQKIDKAVDAASGAFGIAFGTAGGAAGLAFVTGNGDKIAKLIDAALNWLPLLP